MLNVAREHVSDVRERASRNGRSIQLSAPALAAIDNMARLQQPAIPTPQIDDARLRRH